MRAPKATRVLGVCGFTAAVLSMLGGFANAPLLVGVAGAVMIVGNVYAMVMP